MRITHLRAVGLALLTWISCRGAIADVVPADYRPINAQLRIPGLPPPPPPSCTRTADDPGQVQEAGHLVLPTARQSATHIAIITAGQRVLLKLPGLWSHESARVWASVFVKSFGTEPFQLVCRHILLDRSSSASYFLAMRPGEGEWSIWRIELTAAASRASPHTDDIAVLRDPYDANRAVTPPQPEVWNNSSAYLCQTDQRAVEDRARSSRGFAGKVRLDVNIGQARPALNPLSHTELEHTLLRAVTIWVQACLECSAAHLAVVGLDGRLYVRQGLQKWYSATFPLGRGGLRPPDVRQLDRELRSDLQPVTWLVLRNTTNAPQAKNLTEYEEASGDFRSLCSMRLTTDTPPTLGAVRRALCGPVNPDERAKIIIRFRSSQTACGFGPNLIACRADPELTEYNVRDFQFVIDSSRSDIEPIGVGPERIELLHVILHEMGHWIGLPHLGVDQSIMNPSFQASRCIDSTTADLLATTDEAGMADERNAGPQAFTFH